MTEHFEPPIAALSTPAAPAGLGVIRVSGPAAVRVASRVFRPLNPARSLDRLPGYTAAYGHVYDPEGDIDECVALVFRAPHSYTGEDVVELSCHGGLYLLQRTLRALLTAGARAAGPGEFTRRAFVNGKMDLTQAEAVMDLIGAEGRLAAKTALASQEGAVFRRLSALREELLAAQANFSAFVDYPDDDIPDLAPEAMEEVLASAEALLSRLLEGFDAGKILREGIDTAIVGSPNVGKSTLMNLLAGCQRSIVTPIAGTTRDVVEETVRLGEVVLRLADTAGIRRTEDQVEAIGVDRARARMETAALVLAVLDGSQPLSGDDRALLEALPECAIVLVNKTDRGLNIDEKYIKSIDKPMVYISAAQGEGLEELTRQVERLTGVSALSESEPLLATERQRDCVRRCLECVREAHQALGMGMTMDAVSVSVDGAVSSLLELTGERASEAVVDAIFARFCVGK